MTTPTRLPRQLLTFLLGVAIVVAGLLIPSAPPATADEPSDVSICDTEPGLCTPAPLLNEQLLQDPNGFFYATSIEKASLRRLETKAVAQALDEFDLPVSDAAAMQSWGRDEALAQLWALLLEAVRTAPDDRTDDQTHAVTWMTQMMRRKAKEIGLNAGWEFLQWAGHVSSSDPRPTPPETSPLCGVLQTAPGFPSTT